ncbi:MAG: chemotaxis protein CheW [Desulfuromonadales bacterium]|nr:chemotaxis protein CheW [Desulfuromonadales bacterium]
MDLAKIRQKACQERENRHLEETPPLTDALQVSAPLCDVAPPQHVSDGNDSIERVEPAPVTTPSPAVLLNVLPSGYIPRDPVEVILAGREASGCDEYQTETEEAQSDARAEEYQECLCFRVSDEVYGINIMDIKELIKPREVTEVPRVPSFVSGVISLRGIIIPIIDMPDRLGLARKTVTGRERVIVVRHDESFSGLLVDEIIQVVRIAAGSIEAAPTVLEGIDRDFVTGIGRTGGRMIILLNLENITDIQLY